MIKILSKILKITDSDWQMGHSKIYLRRDLATKLDRIVLLRVYCAVQSKNFQIAAAMEELL